MEQKRGFVHYIKQIFRLIVLKKGVAKDIATNKFLNKAAVILFLVPFILLTYNWASGPTTLQMNLWIQIQIIAALSATSLFALFLTHLVAKGFGGKANFISTFRSVSFAVISILLMGIAIAFIVGLTAMLMTIEDVMIMLDVLGISWIIILFWILCIMSRVFEETHQISILKAIIIVFISFFITYCANITMVWLIG